MSRITSQPFASIASPMAIVSRVGLPYMTMARSVDRQIMSSIASMPLTSWSRTCIVWRARSVKPFRPRYFRTAQAAAIDEPGRDPAALGVE